MIPVHHSARTPAAAAAFRTPPWRTHGRCAGLVLIECLAYLGLWLLLASLGFTLFYRTMSQHRDLQRATEDILRTVRAGEQWRHDLRQAARPPVWAPLDEPGATELHLPGATTLVAYRSTPTNVLRRTLPEGNWVEVLRGIRSSRMIREDRDGVVAWRWEIELKTRARAPVVEPRFTFQAVHPQETAP
jgi:hypothetical protein